MIKSNNDLDSNNRKYNMMTMPNPNVQQANSNKDDVEMGYNDDPSCISSPSITDKKNDIIDGSTSPTTSSSTPLMTTTTLPQEFDNDNKTIWAVDSSRTIMTSSLNHPIQRRKKNASTLTSSVDNVDDLNRSKVTSSSIKSSSSHLLNNDHQSFTKRIKRGTRQRTNSNNHNNQSTLSSWLSTFQNDLSLMYQYFLDKCYLISQVSFLSSYWSTKTRTSSSLQLSSSSSVLFLHPTISIPLLVFIDMFAVSLVVPLLFQYYQRAGIHNANQREILSSIFSCSQIIGGIVMSFSTDAYHIQRRTLLLYSFIGSAISYGLIIYGGIYPLIISRILVGLVKQTMTVTTTMMTQLTTSSNRAKYMGRITAASTVAWIIGPSFGSLLYKNIDYRAPAYVACIMFILNIILVILWIHDDDHIIQYAIRSKNNNNTNHLSSSISSSSSNHHNNVNNSSSDQLRDSLKKSNSIVGNDEIYIDDDNEVNNFIANGEQQLHHTTTISSSSSSNNNKATTVLKKKDIRILLSNLRICFSSKILGSIVITKLLLTWVGQATNYSSLGSFYEEMYSLQPYHRGYISSYQQLLQFIVQSFLVDSILHYIGGERKVTCYFAILVTIAILLEIQRSLWFFLLILTPCISLCFSMIQLSIQTLITHIAPTQTIFSVLAALDVLQNVAHVTVPFYRTILFRYLQKQDDNSIITSSSQEHLPKRMIGDPDPIKWIISSSFHWMIVSIIVTYLLLYNNVKEWEHAEQHHDNDNNIVVSNSGQDNAQNQSSTLHSSSLSGGGDSVAAGNPTTTTANRTKKGT